jgi:hypothetical protein
VLPPAEPFCDVTALQPASASTAPADTKATAAPPRSPNRSNIADLLLVGRLRVGGGRPESANNFPRISFQRACAAPSAAKEGTAKARRLRQHGDGRRDPAAWQAGARLILSPGATTPHELHRTRAFRRVVPPIALRASAIHCVMRPTVNPPTPAMTMCNIFIRTPRIPRADVKVSPPQRPNPGLHLRRRSNPRPLAAALHVLRNINSTGRTIVLAPAVYPDVSRCRELGTSARHKASC